jgi:hypothetical protein
VAAAVTAVLGALVLGEYEFDGLFSVLAGLLFGLLEGELVTAVGGRRSRALGSLAAIAAAAGIIGAGWIDAGEGIQPMKGTAWVAALLAACVAGAWAGWVRYSRG